MLLWSCYTSLKFWSIINKSVHQFIYEVDFFLTLPGETTASGRDMSKAAIFPTKREKKEKKEIESYSKVSFQITSFVRDKHPFTFGTLSHKSHINVMT